MGRGWSSSVLGPAALAAAAAVHADGAAHARGGHRALGADRAPARRATRSPGRSRRSAGCCVVVVLTTPLQSAAEEYLFRGYLSQAIAGVGALAAGRARSWPAWSPRRCSRRRTCPPDLPTFLDRFAFGLAASAVVWLTGGLEAAIVLHAVNNVLVFVLAGALGDGVGHRVRRPAGSAWCAAGQRAVGGRLRGGGGALAAPAPAGDPHRGRRPADPGRARPGRRRLTRRTGVGATGPRAVGYRLLRRREVPPMGYGVIGSPTVSGSVSLGSSPGTPARKHHLLDAVRSTARPRRLAAQDAALSRR